MWKSSPPEFMTDILNKTIVLLNRNWQAINIRTPADAFCQMATNVATALDIELGDDARGKVIGGKVLHDFNDRKFEAIAAPY
jgi:hypothetical protein